MMMTKEFENKQLIVLSGLFSTPRLRKEDLEFWESQSCDPDIFHSLIFGLWAWESAIK